jgi:cobalt-zinc-cadmium efflux system membrane fusion protein
LFLVAVIAAGCSREDKVDANTVAAAVKVEEVSDPNIIQVERAERFPLVKVQARSLRDELKVNAAVAPDVNRTVPVNSLSMGRVLDVRARLGDDVRKGQVLLAMNAPDVTQAFSDYHKARADEVLTRTALERARTLIEHGAIAQKDLEVAEDTANKAKVDVQTAVQRIRVLGGDVDHPSPVIEVKAPVSGTIVEQNTTAGAGVKSLDNSPNLFTIADLSHVWVLCDVYENNLSQVHVGELAKVQLNAYPERILQGRISNISRVLDPATRTAKVRLDLQNPGGLLRPGMFATVTFFSSGAKKIAAVPAAAVLRLHDKYWVFQPAGQNRFRRLEVQAGAVLPDKTQEIRSGLAPGDEVVANALEMSSSSGQQ